MAVTSGIVLRHAGVVSRVASAEARESQQRREGVHLGHGHPFETSHVQPVLEPAEADREVSPGQPAQQSHPDAFAVDGGAVGVAARAERHDLWGH